MCDNGKPDGGALNWLQPGFCFRAISESGHQIECKAFCAYSSGETGRDYIVYTADSGNGLEDPQLYASSFDPHERFLDGQGETAIVELTPIQTDDEWHIIETMLAQMEYEDFDDDLTSEQILGGSDADTSDKPTQSDGRSSDTGVQPVIAEMNGVTMLFPSGTKESDIAAVLRAAASLRKNL